MVAYLIEIPYPKYLLFTTLTKFQQYMSKKIRWILTAPDGLTKIQYNRST